MAETTSEQLNSVGIVKISPPILERGLVWFQQNDRKIKSEARKITSWWSANYKEIEKDELIPLSNLARQLSDWGYIKTETVRAPGEYAGRGGILDIFPPNMKNAVRLEYWGNAVSSITVLEAVKNNKPEEKLKNIVSKQPQDYSHLAYRLASLPRRSGQAGKNEDAQKHIENLIPGTFVVHADHGVALLKGRKSEIRISKSENSPEEEYLELEYAQGDRLLVPLTVAEKVSPYVGFGEPHLTRLGGNIWEKTKRKVKEDLMETAKRLAKIYAKREMTHRPRYKIDNELESALKYSFEFEETPDQIQALKEVKYDMMRPMPMDRVVCGDVGFGKTEVAIRAAAYAVGAGHQVALITPTTVLAHQHYKTFTKRFEETSHPIHIRKLTRVEKPAEQKRILSELKNGSCDIVIGTHRLLQKDIEFSKLGLLLIDEEQRFGVKQKEFFKERRAEVDIMSLSATPIPRTLHFTLSGLRDMSIISTPPPGRIPIKTEVKRFSKKNIQSAIERELARGGQVYYLHNRIGSMQKTVKMLEELLSEVPTAKRSRILDTKSVGTKIGYMHAKLNEARLIETIDDFSEGKIDVLVTTTIMENGLDVSNANTLIVEDATKLGLAQAHQIRGRVGRGREQAHAFFFYPARKLKDKAKARLTALEDAQYLGAGYQIAMRDLELRGAGNFLGKEQSGSIAKVGFNLYCQLLNEAIEELRQG
ncbi:MAG: DEAD/DEAH box helicase [Candidatus Spechtbacterales bacterium]